MLNLILKIKLLYFFNLLKKKTILINQKKILSRKKIEIIYNDYLFNILKGIYKIQIFNNMKNLRIYNSNNNFKKLIALKQWKGRKNIICINNYNDFVFSQYSVKIIQGCYIFDRIYFLFHNQKILDLINIILRKYMNYNQLNCYKIKLNLFLFIIQKKIINKKKKSIFHIFFNIFKSPENKRDLLNKIPILHSAFTKIISLRLSKYKKFFIDKFIDYYTNIKIKQSKLFFKENNNFVYSTKYKIKAKKNNINNKLKATNIFLKYYQKNFIKNHYLFSKKFAFIHWSSFISTFPSFLNKKSKEEKEEEQEDIITQEKEIKELKKSLKEDQDFQHDLKAKIAALDEENNFINEKIYDITQRVERCEKCNNLLKSSYISENNFRTSYGSIIVNKPVEENIPQKSRNMAGKEVTSSSGFNFITGGTELVPKTPRGYNKKEEYSVPESMEIDDENDEDENNKRNEINKEWKEDKESIKQKIMELKKEKEPIVNKLKQEIIELYRELDME